MASIDLALLLIFLAFSLHFQGISSTSDPDDLTFISKWAAIGDSYLRPQPSVRQHILVVVSGPQLTLSTTDFHGRNSY
jgi:hypothetical protein